MLFKIPVESIQQFNPDSVALCEKKGSRRTLHGEDVFVIEPRSVGFNTELFWHIRDNGDALFRTEIMELNGR